MSNVNIIWRPAKADSLAKQFSRLGWLGFWIQLALITAPTLLFVYAAFWGELDPPQRSGTDLSDYLSNGSLVMMLFTTYWFYRYTRLGKRIADPVKRPARKSVEQTLWVGVWAGCLGILLSMGIMLAAVVRLLFVLLANPQTGLVLTPASSEGPSWSISAMDMLSQLIALRMLGAELLVLGLSLWLLFRTTMASDGVQP